MVGWRDRGAGPHTARCFSLSLSFPTLEGCGPAHLRGSPWAVGGSSKRHVSLVILLGSSAPAPCSYAHRPPFPWGLSPTAAMTNHHKPSGFTQHTVIPLWFCKPGVQTKSPWARVKVLVGLVPAGGSRKIHFLPLPAPRGAHTPHLVAMSPSLCSSTSNVPLPLSVTPMIASGSSRIGPISRS